MAHVDGPVHALIAWAAGPAAGRLTAPPPLRELARGRRVGELVRSAWSDPEVAAAVVGAVATAPVGDGLMTQVGLAVVAPGLARVLRRWARCGVDPVDLADLESDLVTEALAVLRAGPPSGPVASGWVVDRAWDRTRKRRRRDRARQASHRPLDDTVVAAAPAEGERAVVVAAGVVVDAFRAGRLGLGSARVLWLTGVAGCSCREAAARLGVAATAVRQRRSRALRSVAAA